ncbi:MAG: oligosaccharide flippase family protein [Candidatus Paceibacterota bacterium]
MEISKKKLDIIDAIHRLWSLFCSDSLFRNSVYLMLSTGVMAGFGFIFWIIATHFYNSEEIGFATALISVTVLISSLSLFGFNSSLIRYLVQSKRPNQMINTAMTIVTLSTVVLSIIYLFGIEYFSPAFHMLFYKPLYAVLFIIFMIAVSLNTLTDSVFVAHRLSKYNFIVYTFFGFTKTILPFFLLSLGAYGVFFSYTGAVVVAFILSIYFMISRFNYRPAFAIDYESARQMVSFSLSNYLVGFIFSLPAALAPILIVNELGATDSAYFYMASTIAALLYIIPTAITQSLFAEGAYSEKDFISFVKKATKFIVLFLLPAILVVFLLGKYILLVFGEEYSINSYYLLQIMAISSVFLAINLIGATILRIRHRMMQFLIINIIYLIFTVFLFYLLMPVYGTVGVAWALLGGQAFMSACFAILFSKKLIRLFV